MNTPSFIPRPSENSTSRLQLALALSGLLFVSGCENDEPNKQNDATDTETDTDFSPLDELSDCENLDELGVHYDPGVYLELSPQDPLLQGENLPIVRIDGIESPDGFPVEVTPCIQDTNNGPQIEYSIPFEEYPFSVDDAGGVKVNLEVATPPNSHLTSSDGTLATGSYEFPAGKATVLPIKLKEGTPPPPRAN